MESTPETSATEKVETQRLPGAMTDAWRLFHAVEGAEMLNQIGILLREDGPASDVTDPDVRETISMFVELAKAYLMAAALPTIYQLPPTDHALKLISSTWPELSWPARHSADETPAAS